MVGLPANPIMPLQLCAGWLRGLESTGLRREGGTQADCDRRHRFRQFAMIRLIDQTANQGQRVVSPAVAWYVWLATIDLMLEAVE